MKGKNGPSHRLQLILSTATQKRLLRIQKKADIPTYSEVVRRALEAYEKILDEKKE